MNNYQTYYVYYQSAIGKLLLTSDGKNMTGIYFASFGHVPEIRVDWQEDTSVFRGAINELDEYFAGTRREFDIPVLMSGSEFQKSVWQQLLAIPYGKTVSYKDIAVAVGRPKAVRAVGTAVGSNPVCVITPCHRVISSDGSIGGYAGGLENKKILLDLEGIQIS